MSCQHCCGANLQFDLKNAKKDLKRYLKKGPRKPTQLLVEALRSERLVNLSLLDIGGGVGIIPLELLPNGISKVTDVDASEGYIEVAKSEAKKRKLIEHICYELGDFVDVQEHLEKYDIVTLDKVICCYPHLGQLLKTSLSKATTYYGLVYPQANFLSYLVVWFLNLLLKLRGNSFRTFIHSPALIDTTITDAGFKKIASSKTLLSWQIDLYKKNI